MYKIIKMAGDLIVSFQFMFAITLFVLFFSIVGHLILINFNLNVNYFAVILFSYKTIPLTLLVIFLPLFLERLHYLVIKLQYTEKGNKYASIFIVVSIIIFQMHYTNKYVKYDDKQLINMYKNYEQSATKHKDETILKSNDFKEYKSKIKYHTLLIKTALFILIMSYATYIFYILIRTEVAKIEYPKNKFYFKWYLSESLGWIKGTVITTDINKTVLRPDDCLKELTVYLDYSKEFLETDNYRLFVDTIKIADPDLLYEAVKSIYKTLDTCKTSFLHYEEKRINRAVRKYAELPKILNFAISAKIVKQD